MKKVKNGSIIQFHTGTSHTAEALPEILEFFKNKNIKCVPVGELIYYDNFTINHNGTQICNKEVATES